jgi:hypothetical protein
MRGCLNDKIQDLAKKFLKREITTTELRLYPYLDYVMKNYQWIDPRKINSDDRTVMAQLRSENYIDYHTEVFEDKPAKTYLNLTKEFYDYMCQVLWYGYIENPELLEDK